MLSSGCSSAAPLPAGDPLRSYFPIGTDIREDLDGVTVREPTASVWLHYQRAATGTNPDADYKRHGYCVQDIIITGEVRDPVD